MVVAIVVGIAACGVDQRGLRETEQVSRDAAVSDLLVFPEVGATGGRSGLGGDGVGGSIDVGTGGGLGNGGSIGTGGAAGTSAVDAGPVDGPMATGGAGGTGGAIATGGAAAGGGAGRAGTGGLGGTIDPGTGGSAGGPGGVAGPGSGGTAGVAVASGGAGGDPGAGGGPVSTGGTGSGGTGTGGGGPLGGGPGPSSGGAGGGRGGGAGTGGTAMGGKGGATPLCDANTCSMGCCAGGSCIQLPTAMQCGHGGLACQACGGCQRCTSGGTCELDPGSYWKVTAVSASVKATDPTGAVWDFTGQKFGGALPDPFMQLESPPNTPIGSTSTKVDDIMPMWNEQIHPDGSVLAASTFLPGGRSWRIVVADDDKDVGELMCAINGPLMPAEFLAGGFTRSNIGSCTSVTIALTCSP